MKYRIVEENGLFTPQIKSFIWWIPVGFSYRNKGAAMEEIVKHYRTLESKPEPIYHYINVEDIIL